MNGHGGIVVGRDSVSPICRRRRRESDEHFRTESRTTWEMLTSFRLAALDIGLDGVSPHLDAARKNCAPLSGPADVVNSSLVRPIFNSLD